MNITYYFKNFSGPYKENIIDYPNTKFEPPNNSEFLIILILMLISTNTNANTTSLCGRWEGIWRLGEKSERIKIKINK